MKDHLTLMPVVSEASLKNGIWLVCPDGEDTIRAWSSAFNGVGRIYMNNELIMEERNFKLSDTMKFQHGKHSYEYSYKTNSLLQGEVHYTFKKDEVVLKEFMLKYEKPNNLTVKRIVMLLSVSVVSGIILGTFQFPRWAFYVSIFTIAGMFMITRKKGQLVITEKISS